MANQYDSLGFDPRTQQEILDERTRARWQAQIDGQPKRYMSPADQTAGQLGTILGGLFSNKFNPTQLNSVEQRDQNIKTRAHSLYTERLNANPNIGEEDKALLLQRSAADAHFEAGNYELYNKLILDTAQRERARKQALSQQALLDNEVETLAQQNEIITARAEAATSGESFPFIGLGEDPLVATPRIGRLMPDQSVEVHNEDGTVEIVKQYIPLNEALAITRAKQQADEDANGMVPVHRLWSSEQRAQLKNAPLEQLKQVDIIDSIVDTVWNVVEDGGDPDTLMQTPGGILSWVDKVRATTKAGSNYATEFSNPDGLVVFKGDLSSESQRRALMAASPEIKGAYDRIRVPAALKNEAERQAFRSAVFQLAWTTWRSSEGEGARQASNQDFAIALDELGANAGSIRAMLGTALRRLSRGNEAYSNLIASTRAQGRYGGWTQERVDGQIFGNMAQRASDEMQRSLGRMNQLIREPDVEVPNAAPPEDIGPAPPGVDPQDWPFMSPEDRALFN